MDKAIIKLKNIQNNPNFCDNCQGLDYCNNFNEKKICNIFFEINEALAELQAHKAKIESLKEKYKKDIERLQSKIDSCVFIPAKQGYKVEKAIYADILQKLEELDK